jgi:hypothetical protein
LMLRWKQMNCLIENEYIKGNFLHQKKLIKYFSIRK